jgi:peptide/nickel transport system permease protein
VRLADGTLRYADEVRPRSDGSVELVRGRKIERLTRNELAAEWDTRPFYLLGTDGFGRDMLSRLIHGGRVSLLVGLGGAAIALFIGTTVGLLAGLAGGWVDAMLMRFTDVVLSVPRLFLALLLVALYGPSLTVTIAVLATTTWMAAARLVRGEVLSLREREFVQAARAAGTSPWRLGIHHLLPAVLTPIAIEGSLRVGDTILLESALSYLELGVRPPTASWGNLIADGRHSLLDAWWIATLPGLAIVATVVALHYLGQGVRHELRVRRPAAPRSLPAPSITRRLVSVAE